MIKLIPDWAYWLALAALIFLGGLTQVQLARERTAHAVTKKQFAEHQRKVFDDQVKKDEGQKVALAALDTKHTKELTDAKLEISRLSDSVRTGERRLRLNATCPADTVAQATSAPGVAYVARPRLDDAVEQNYFNLRAGIETATKQIEGLQGYITTVCLQ